MKYAQLIMGLLIGTALGGIIVASQGSNLSTSFGGSAAIDADRVKEIARETIREEGKLIMDAVQAYQNKQRQEQQAMMGEALKDEAVKEAVFNDRAVPFIGNPDSTRIVAEFFDYNCPACKMQYKALDELVKKDKDVKVVLHEFPIFGPQSETNSKISLGVFKVAPKKYADFHAKMMAFEGRADEAAALKLVKEVGVNVEKVKAYAASEEATAELEKSRSLGRKLGAQGTPTLVIGNEVIPHAASAQDIESKLGN